MENKKSIGGVWVKTNQYGDYLSIALEVDGIKRNYVAFRSKKPDGSKGPDYYIPVPQNRREPQSFGNANEVGF